MRKDSLSVVGNCWPLCRRRMRGSAIVLDWRWTHCSRVRLGEVSEGLPSAGVFMLLSCLG